MLENEINLQEYENGREKKKKKMVSESDGCLMEICSTSTVSLEQLNEGLASSSETLAGEEKHGKKKKQKKKMEGGVAEVSAEVSVSESITVERGEGRKRKRRWQQQGNEEEDGSPVVSEMEGALVEERKKKKKKKRSEMSDILENALAVPDIAEERVSEKKKKRQKDSEVEQDNNTMGAEEIVKKKKLSEMSDILGNALEVPDIAEERVSEKKKKRRKDSEVEQDNSTMGAEEIVKKKKQSEMSDILENSLEVPDIAEESVSEKKKKRRKDSEVEQDNNTMGAEEIVKKNKKKWSEMSDILENALEVPDIAEERVSEKKKKRRKDSEVEQDNNTMGAEEMVKKKKKHRERDENSAGESSSVILSDDLEEQEMQYKVNSKTEKLATADAVEKDLKSVDDDLEGVEENISISAQNVKDADMQRCIEELKEFIPNVETKSPFVVNQLVKYDLSRFKTLKQEGESFKSGRFSAEENEKLLQNIKDFLVLTGISSGAKLFFPNRYPEEAAEIRNMKKLHKFHSQIAVGIFRSWHEIYSRGRKVFDDFNYKGRYTEAELKSLNKLQNLYGNNWMKISELTGRSSTSLEKRFSQIAHKKGEWTTSEQKKLMRIIKEYMVTKVEPEDGTSEPTIRKEKLYSNVPWKSVSERMKNRNWVQCRVKWMAVLKRKMTSGADVYKGRKSLQAKIRLIRALYEMDVEDSSDVKWEDLTVTVGNVPPAYIQAKFYKLKVTQVPLWQSMSFGDIIGFLYNKVLPNLEKDLKNCEEEAVLPKDIFRLSEIFDTDEE